MSEVDFTGLRTVAMAATRQPEFSDIEQRAARVRRHWHLASAGAATAAVVLALAGTGYAFGGLGGAAPSPAGTGTAAIPGDPPSGPVRRVVNAYAGDSTHLYAITQSCDPPSECPVDLYGSDDGGRTWHGRTLPSGYGSVALGMALGPRTLVAPGGQGIRTPVTPGGDITLPKRTQYISADGGATWRTLEESAEPVDAVPAGHRAYGCTPWSRTESCTVRVVDPVTALVAPLANQPPIYAVDLLDAPPQAGLWVSGFDADSQRPAVAWSRDAGRTWTKHVFTEADLVPANSTPGLPPLVHTADGRTAYAMVGNDQDVARIYRTVDGGATWSPSQEGERVPGFVAGDGAHVLALSTGGGVEYLASRDGGTYHPQQMTGVPAPPRLPQAVTGGGYVTTVWADPTAVYLSDDGLSWRRVAVG